MQFLKDINFTKGWTLVISAFMIVFAFSTVDHAISPMVAVLESVFSVRQERILWLISSCTIGIVMGLFFGPQLIKSYKVKFVLIISSLMMIVGLVAFVSIEVFYVSLIVRFIIGLGAGFMSTIMWWLAYESIDRTFYTAMITVLTASRPMAVAAGVPLVMYATKFCGWAMAFGFMALLLLAFGIALLWSLPSDDKEKTSFTLKNIILSYKTAFKTPYLKQFFSAMFINRICYFGFYSMLGIWFMQKYDLSTLEIARPLMVIGICETLINFIVPKLMKIGQKKLFYISTITNIIIFSAFIWGGFPLWWGILLIAIFAMTDRVYNMLLLIFIPKVFAGSKDRTTIGSLVTLVSWTALAFISYIEGSFLDYIGINAIAAGLILALVCGVILYVPILKKTVF